MNTSGKTSGKRLIDYCCSYYDSENRPFYHNRRFGTIFLKPKDRIEPAQVLSVASNAFFAIYFFLALYLYRERLFGDAAYYLFNIINYGNLFIVHDRFGAALTQLPALIALKANLGLESIAQIFSASLVCFHYVVFLLIQYLYKEKNLAFLIVLSLSLGVEHTFYWSVGELSQALAFSVLYFAALTSQNAYGNLRRKGNSVLMIIVFMLALLNHPLNLVIIVYVTLFDLLYKKRGGLLHFTAIGLCILYLAFRKFFGPSYEAHKMSVTLHHIDLNFLYQVLLLFLKKYSFHLLFLFLVLFYYFAKREYLLFLFVLSSFCAYVALINVTYDLPMNWFYTEHLYLPLTMIVALPLLGQIFQQTAQPVKLGYVVLWMLCLIYSLYAILSTGNVYAARLQKMKNMIYQEPLCQHSKFVVDINNYHERDSTNKEIHLYWTYPSETLVQTSIEGVSKTLVFSNELDQSIKDPKARIDRIALAPWHSIDHRELNKRYFSLRVDDYLPLNTPMNFNLLTEEFIRNIHIEVRQQEKSLRRNTMHFLSVLVQNRNLIPLRSGLPKGREIYVSYHWQKGNEIHVWDGERTPLEVDLYGFLVQKIKVRAPETPGLYTLTVDIVAENFRWFGINKKASFTVY